MKHNNSTMDESFWKQVLKYTAEFFNEYSFAFFSTLGVLGLRLRKKMSIGMLISKIIFAFFFSWALYYGAKKAGFYADYIVGVIGVLSYMIDDIIKMLVTLLKNTPKLIISLVKGKLNLKEDCKIDKEE